MKMQGGRGLDLTLTCMCTHRERRGGLSVMADIEEGGAGSVQQQNQQNE